MYLNFAVDIPDELAAAKIFVEFVALIICYRIYMLLQREKARLDKNLIL